MKNKRDDNTPFHEAYRHWKRHGDVPPNCDFTIEDMEECSRMDMIALAGIAVLGAFVLGGAVWLAWSLLSQ